MIKLCSKTTCTSTQGTWHWHDYVYAKRESWVDRSSIQKVKPSSAVVERIFRVALLIVKHWKTIIIFFFSKLQKRVVILINSNYATPHMKIASTLLQDHHIHIHYESNTRC